MYQAFDFMKAAEEQRGRVLVHCVQGVSSVRLSSLPPKSCTLAIAWLMLTKGVDYDEAYLRVRQGRPICAPQHGLHLQPPREAAKKAAGECSFF
ncbi:unnamed protein product [Ectocarpus sp. 8 AP-2014]